MSKEFVTAPADIQKLAASILSAEHSSTTGRATYLRSLVAVVQQTLGGKPVLRVTGRPRRPEIDDAVAAFEVANETFYGAVLEAVPKDTTPEERQSKTSFARSASATLRRALKAGWNPLGEACTAVSKGRLAAFSREHYPSLPPTVNVLERRVMRYTQKVADMVAALPVGERNRVLGMVLADLGQAPIQDTPQMRNISVRRQAVPPRPVPH